MNYPQTKDSWDSCFTPYIPTTKDGWGFRWIYINIVYKGNLEGQNFPCIYSQYIFLIEYNIYIIKYYNDSN